MSGWICQGSQWRAGVKWGKWRLDGTEVHIWCRHRWDTTGISRLNKREQLRSRAIPVVNTKCFYRTGDKWVGQVSCFSCRPLNSTVCENAGMWMEIHRQGQEAAECQALSRPIGRPPADFLCLASRIPAPCRQRWAEGRGWLQRMPTPSASWGQSPLLQFPDVWKEHSIKIC